MTFFSRRTKSDSSTDSQDVSTGGKGAPEWVSGAKQGLLIGAVAALLLVPIFRSHFARPPVAPVAAAAAPVLAVAAPRFADFKGEGASPDAVYVANWVADSHDNASLPFVVIDKKNTKVFLFDADGKLVAATPVLMGITVGDDTVEGVGGKPMSQVKENEKTTPAGRFIGEPGRNLTGEDVVWIDYHAAVSMHRVRIVDPKDRRLERLASPTTDDNRISYGCVNMPIAFFEKILKPVFDKSYGVIYVLPEQKTVQAVFGKAYDVAARHGGASSVATAN